MKRKQDEWDRVFGPTLAERAAMVLIGVWVVVILLAATWAIADVIW